MPVCSISIHALRVEGDRSYMSRICCAIGDFYPRPPGGGRLCCILLLSVRFCISIHALRVEGDAQTAAINAGQSDFYPRPPGGGRLQDHKVVKAGKRNFYPRPPGGGRRSKPAGQPSKSPISIHALRVEGDSRTVSKASRLGNFYPRPPGGGRPAITTR